MPMTEVKLKVPVVMRSYIDSADEETQLLQKALLLYPYIKNQTISHGRAAELLGIHKLDLIAMYGNLGIPYLDCDISDIEQDVKTLREILVTA